MRQKIYRPRKRRRKFPNLRPQFVFLPQICEKCFGIIEYQEAWLANIGKEKGHSSEKFLCKNCAPEIWDADDFFWKFRDEQKLAKSRKKDFKEAK